MLLRIGAWRDLARTAVGLCVGVGGLLPAVLQAAEAPPAEFRFPRYADARQVEQACSGMVDDLRRQAQQLAERSALAGQSLPNALDAITRRAEDTAGPLGVLGAVHPDKVIRDAADACDLRYQEFSSVFFQTRAIYEALRDWTPADAIDARYRRDLLDVFEGAGVALPPARQSRVRALTAEITRLTQSFERRIREHPPKLAFAAAELQGVPAAVWQSAPRDGQGRYLLTLDAPTVQPLLDHARRSATREAVWRAYQRQGGATNLKTLARLVRARRELARLFGFASYDEFVLRRRMAHDEDNVRRFLDRVGLAVEQRERDELAQLRAEKARDLRQPHAVLKRWDVNHYLERLRQTRFRVEQERFRSYLPPQASLDFVFELARRLFGVRFEADPQAQLWHPDARAFWVRDEASQQLLGNLFVDLYPRAGKFNHAAVWSFRNASTREQRLPAAALVVNFNRQGLSQDELETLLHEFGHSLHSLLSRTRYAGQGGTSTLLDFVEAPSQMLEDWIDDPRVMALYQDVCADCRPLPEGWLSQARGARELGKGVQLARQRLFASYDLTLHSETQADPLALWRRMENATPLGHVRGSLFPAGFAHIAGGYAAGYYGYLWSLVLAEDMRTQFAADRLSREAGMRYREQVLSQGGQVHPSELLRHFLGRDSNDAAFFKALQQRP